MSQDFKSVIPEGRNHVVFDNKLFDFTGMDTLSIDCMRILMAIIADVTIDNEPCLYYKIKVSDLAKFYDIDAKNFYRSSCKRKICDEFFDAKLENYKSKYYKLRIIQKAAYENGEYYIEFSREFTKFIFELKRNFSKPELSCFKNLSTTNSCLFWLLISSKMQHSLFDVTKITTVELTIEEILYFTGNYKKKSMKQYKNLKRRLIEPCLKEYINNFYLQDIQLIEIKKRRKVEKIQLKLIGKFCKLKNEE
jgi:hypothetical protein